MQGGVSAEAKCQSEGQWGDAGGMQSVRDGEDGETVLKRGRSNRGGELKKREEKYKSCRIRTESGCPHGGLVCESGASPAAPFVIRRLPIPPLVISPPADDFTLTASAITVSFSVLFYDFSIVTDSNSEDLESVFSVRSCLAVPYRTHSTLFRRFTVKKITV